MLWDFMRLAHIKFSRRVLTTALDRDTTCQIIMCLETHFWFDISFFSSPFVSFPAVANSRGEYLLNGDFVVSMFKREVKVGRAVLEYSGSDHIVERLNCTDRIEEEIVIQVHAETVPLL